MRPIGVRFSYSAMNLKSCASSRTPPGTSVLARMPSGAPYSASHRVKLSTPDLATL